VRGDDDDSAVVGGRKQAAAQTVATRCRWPRVSCFETSRQSTNGLRIGEGREAVDVELVTRVLIVAAATVLAVALVALGPSSAPRPHRVRGVGRRPRRHAPVDATNVLTYLAASMAVTLGGALALMR
jgi:hypothetical protein